jgi:predicted nucleic acid-binding protein
MRIVVDTNVVFSAILNTNSKIGKILLHPKSKINFYSTDTLKLEIEEHKSKIKRLSGLTESEFEIICSLIISRIRFINVEVIPIKILKEALLLCSDIDIDDLEFVALTDHAKAKLWTGDKVLSKGLIRKGWKKIITTSDLYELIRIKRIK